MDTKLTVTTITDPEDNSLAYAITDPTGRAIAVVAQEDDAFLLAKAPALLEALHLYMQQYPEATSTNDGLPQAFTSAGCHARALLRKFKL